MFSVLVYLMTSLDDLTSKPELLILDSITITSGILLKAQGLVASETLVLTNSTYRKVMLRCAGNVLKYFSWASISVFTKARKLYDESSNTTGGLT